MPEAAMDKEHGAARAEDEIGFARKIAALQAVAEAEGGDQLADKEFRLGIPAADLRHVARAGLRCEAVAGGWRRIGNGRGDNGWSHVRRVRRFDFGALGRHGGEGQ